MRLLPGVEKFARRPVYDGVNVQIVAAAAQIRHHLVRHVKQVVHLHMDIIGNLVAGVFIFIIMRRPVGDGFHRGDQKHDHQTESTDKPQKPA